MAGEIFISYRRADERLARLLHAQLKERGVEAWYDVHVAAGEDWRTATARALERSRIFVLLYSRAASESEDIAKELAAATFSKKLVVPVRIENIAPSGAFLYELASRNWINAFEDTDAQLAGLADKLAALVKAGPDADPAAFASRAADPPARARGMRLPFLIALGAATALAIAFALFLFRPQQHAIAESRPTGQRIAFFGIKSADGDQGAGAVANETTDEMFQSFTSLRFDVASRAETRDVDSGAQLERARALGATYALSGEAHASNGRLRISLRLDDVPTQTMLLERVFSEESSPVALRVMAVSQASNTLQCVLRTRADLADGGAGLLQLIADSCKTGTFVPLSQASAIRDLAARAPNSAYVQARLAGTVGLQIGNEPPAQRPILLAEAERAMSQAEQLAPDESFVRTMRALLMMRGGHPLAEVEAFLLGSLELPTASSSVVRGGLNFRYALFLSEVGRTEEALAQVKLAAGSDSYNPGANYGLARLLAENGQGATAVQAYESTSARLPLQFGWEQRLRVALFLGYGDPRAVFDAAPADVTDDTVGYWRQIVDAQASRRPADIRRALEMLRSLRPRLFRRDLALIVACSFGDVDYAYEIARDAGGVLSMLGQTGELFAPETRPMRRREAFVQLAKDLGIWDYWMTKDTYPDVCGNGEEAFPLCRELKAQRPPRP
jgi:TolB-like protein